MQAKRDESEYPTNEQMEEMFGAWQKGGKDGILAVLQKRKNERKETTGRMEEQKGPGLTRKRVVELSALSGLVVGVILGIVIGSSLAERFEKTANVNVRFDTRTKQNCWVGPAQWEENTGRLFSGPPTETHEPNIPLCRNL